MMGGPLEPDRLQRLLRPIIGTGFSGERHGDRDIFKRREVVLNPIKMPDVGQLPRIEFLEFLDILPLPQNRSLFRGQQTGENTEQTGFPAAVFTYYRQQ